MLQDAQEGLKGLQDAVGSGVLRVEPGAAERVAQHLDVLAESVKDHARDMRRGNTTYEGFGTFDSGSQLQDGFIRKLRQAIEQLNAYAETVSNMAAAVRAAGSAYTEQDCSNQRVIDAVGEGLQ